MATLDEYAITAEMTRPFIETLRSEIAKRDGVRLVFDNDADGLCGALVCRELVRHLGADASGIEVFHPTTHIEMFTKSLPPNDVFVFIDTQPLYPADHLFCIDHHTVPDANAQVDPRRFIFSPLDPSEPSSSALPASYLLYVAFDGRHSYGEFLRRRQWMASELVGRLVCLGAVCDNLWLLSKRSKTEELRRWLADAGMEEWFTVRAGIAISLMLGRPRRERLEGLEGFVTDPLKHPWDELFSTPNGQVYLDRADALIEFARRLTAVGERWIEETVSRIDADVRQLRAEIARDQARISEFRNALPLTLRTGPLAGFAKDHPGANREQIMYYSGEIEKLTKRVEERERHLRTIEASSAMLDPDRSGMVLFIPKQRSSQVKGILSSLLYYLGHRNIVFEDQETLALWGSRGLSRKELEGYLSILRYDRMMLEYYTTSEVAVENSPPYIKKIVGGLSKQMFNEGMVASGGGRGTVFGGSVAGTVPSLFANLPINELDRKLRELMEHGELGKAIQGLTEGDSVVPVTQLLRNKLRSQGWLAAQVVAGGGSGNITTREYDMVLGWLFDDKRELEI